MKFIKDVLADIEIEEGVKIIFASIIGSRAYGYSNKNSDYDVRFVFVENKRKYISLTKNTDHICQTRLVKNLDIVGYNIDEFLSLVSKSNVDVMNWLHGIPVIDTELKTLISVKNKMFNKFKALGHYYGVISKEYKKEFSDTLSEYDFDIVNVKKMLFIFRNIYEVLGILRNGVLRRSLSEYNESRDDESMSDLDRRIHDNITFLINKRKSNDYEVVYVDREFVERLSSDIEEVLEMIRTEMNNKDNKSDGAPMWYANDALFELVEKYGN